MTGQPAPELVVHWSPGSCARVTLVALEEAGAAYEHRVLPRGDAAAMAAYADTVNPKGKVPALVADGRVLTETPAIQTYLHRAFPAAGLLPEDELEALMLMCWFASGIHPPITRSRFPMFTSDLPESFDAIRRIACDDLRRSFALLEERLADGRTWLFGTWTILDAYLLWLWFRAVGSGLTGAEFPLVDALARRCQERPSVTRILDREADTFAALQRAGHAIPGAPPLQAGWLPARI
jgi:glutathione S-transferase